jgi:hypothetical protein
LSLHRVTIKLDEFGWDALREAADEQGVTLPELVEHAAMYYLADLHSGRAALQIFRRSVAGRPLTRPRGGSVSRLPEREDDDA